MGKIGLYTLPRKSMNLPYSIRIYWTNFWQPTVHVQKNVFEKTLIKDGSSHLYAYFGFFCVQIGQLFEAQWDFKLSEKFEFAAFFLLKKWFDYFQTFFKDSQCLKKLTNLDAKGAKRSVRMWAISFKKIFNNIFFLMNGGLSKISSVLTYILLLRIMY